MENPYTIFPVDTKIVDFLKSSSRFFCFTVIIIAILVLIGWQFDINFFKRPIPVLVAMNPTTAFGFILLSVSLLFLSSDKISLFKKNLGYLLPVIVFIIGIAKILDVVFNFQLNIDKILFSEKIQLDIINNVPNSMAPNTAANFMLASLSMVSFNVKTKKGKFPSQYIALMVASFGMLSVLGYIYKVPSFYGVLKYIPMAIHTAFCFILFSLAILFARPGEGVISEFTSSLSGSITARMLIPSGIIITIGLGYLRLLGHWSGLLSTEFGVALLVLSILIVFLTLIKFNANLLNKRDLLQQKAEEELKKLNEELENKILERTKELNKSEKFYKTLIENSFEGVALLDENLSHVYRTPSLVRMTGFVDEDRVKSKGINTIHPEDVEYMRVLLQAAKDNPGVPYKLKFRMLHKNGHYLWFEGIITGMLHDEFINAIVFNLHDITAHVNLQEEILKLNEDLEQRVVERTAQLEAVNKDLESFSYTVSHDLRAPLRAIDGYTKILKSDFEEHFDDEGKRILNIIITNSKKMAQLIDDLLAFSRLGRREITKLPVSMNQITDEIIKSVKLNWDKHDLNIKVGSLADAAGDRNLIYQVWSNLIENAVKYSSKKEKIEIEIDSQENGEFMIYKVKDNGAGFNMKYADKLFGVFQRLHSEDEFSGTGVGLAIVNKIVTKHGGFVKAESVEGEGSTFYFSLPK